MTKLPPGPKSPSAYQLYRWVAKPIEFYKECVETYGDTFTIRLPQNPPFVVFTNPEHIKEIFTGRPEDLHAGEANRLIESFVGSNSLLILDGARHLRERKLMLPPFHGDRMQAYGEIMRDLTTESCQRWPIGKAFPVQKEMQSLTLEIIIRTVFGIDEGERLSTLRDLLAKLIDENQNPMMLAMSLVLTPNQLRKFFEFGLEPLKIAGREVEFGKYLPWNHISRDGKALDDFLYAEFERRRAQNNQGRVDVLSMLLEARHEDGAPMSNEELRDEMVTLLAAGHETTATTLSWAFYHLTQNPEARQKLQEELSRVVGEGPLQPNQINKLEYLDATIKETLRLTPVISLVARKLTRPLTIGGWDLPEGVFVLPNIYMTHQRPDIYALPQRFWPDRFLAKRPPGPYEFLPFGGGVRRCIGMAFALYEMKIVLAELMRRMDFLADPNTTVKLIRRGIAFAPSDGMPIIAKLLQTQQKPGEAKARPN